MAKPPAFPLIVRNGSVVVKIYRQKAATTKDSIAYCVSWIGERRRARKLFADLAAAREDADRQAAHLAKGMSDSLYLDRSDILELKRSTDDHWRLSVVIGASRMVKGARTCRWIYR